MLLILLALPIIRFYQKKKAEAEKAPELFVIKINGKTIYEKKFEKIFEENNAELERQKGDEYYINTLKKEYAYTLANELMLIKFALEYDISVTKKEVLEEIDRIKEGYTDESFKETLKHEGITLDKLKDSTKNRLLLKKVSEKKVYNDIVITDDEVLDFYKQDEYKIDQITFQDEALALTIYNEIKSGETDFASAQEKYSSGAEPLGAKDAGYIPKSGFPEEFEEALETLKSGEMAEVIHSAFGYHILMLQDKKGKHIPKIDKLKDKIKRILREKKEKTAYSNFMNNLRKEKRIVINDDYFKALENEK
jgi:foldase protein PrsA